MDYDENDLQSKKFQLTCEENNKFPPVFRSYGLPKFFLDDSLQVHLRFDSLVETEVLLGIQSQEENQWIEEFSRGSSGIEFSSSAAESCSILRHNNVWSEATSSESVEMLLKSVGQDEMITGQTIIEESDAGDKMEPKSNLDGSIPSTVGDVVAGIPTILPEKCLESFPELNNDATTKLPQVEATPREGERFGCGSSSELDPNANIEKKGLPETVGNVLVDEKRNDVSQRNDGALIDGFLDNPAMGVSSSPDSMQVGQSATSLQAPASNVFELNNQELIVQVTEGYSQVISDKNAGVFHRADVDDGRKIQVLSKEAHVEEQDLQGNVVTTNDHIIEECSNLLVKESSQVQMIEAGSDGLSSKKSVQVTNWEELVPSDDTQMGNQFVETRLALEERNDGFLGDVVEVGKSNAKIHLTPVLNMDSAVKLTEAQNEVVLSLEKQEDLLQSGHQLESEIAVANSGKSSLMVEDNKLLKGQCEKINVNHEQRPSSLTMEVFLSTNISPETRASKSMHGGCDSLRVCGEDIITGDHISSPGKVESTQMCENNAVIESSDVRKSEVDVSVLEMDNGSIPVDSGKVESEIDGSITIEKTDGSLSRDQTIAKTKGTAHESPSNLLIGDESASTEVFSEVANLTSCSKLDGSDHLLLENHSATNEVTKHREDGKSPLCLADLQSDKEEDAVTGSATKEVTKDREDCKSPLSLADLQSGKQEDAVTEIPTESSHSRVEDEQPRLSVIEQGAARDNAEELLSVTINQPSSTVNTFQKVSEAVVVVKAAQVSSSKVLADVILGDSSLRPDDASKDNAEVHAMKAGSSNINSDEPSCGSPTVISCCEPSQSKAVNQEEVKGCPDQNFPISVNIDKGSNNPNGNSVSEDKSFTFEVSSLADQSERKTIKGWKSFPSVQLSKSPQTLEDSPLTASGLCKIDPKMLQETPFGSPRVSDGESAHRKTKGSTVRRTKRTSSKRIEKETAKERKPLKEITPVKQITEKGDNLCSVSSSSLGTASPAVQGEEVRPYGSTGGSCTNTCSVPISQTSTLPDLNTSASPFALFQQPFSDLQQVQLRAQIFVYGSLIQGTAPDEACMISAFGESDGVRSIWDKVWRVSVEKLNNQKSPLSNPETPLYSRSGARASELASRHSALQNKAVPTSAGRPVSMSPSSAIINPVIPMSSPVWNFPTPLHGLQSGSLPRGSLLDPHQTLTQLYPLQSPHIRHYVGSASPWPSQTPCPVPWVVSPQPSTVNAGSHQSALHVTETAPATAVRESSLPHPSGMQHLLSSSLVHGGSPLTAPGGTAPLLDVRTTVSPVKLTPDSKSRKRKTPGSVDRGQVHQFAQPQNEPLSTTGVPKHLLASAAITTPSTVSRITAGNFVSTVPLTSSTHDQIIGGKDTEQRPIFLEERFCRLDEAKLEAEDASAHAAAATRNCQNVWTQLAIQKNSGLILDVEAKLASAAVAVAAAASVAKAAAAAAKVASNAALQAKLMADEALVSNTIGNCTQNDKASQSDGVVNFGSLTSASILKSKNRKNTSDSIIVAAKEVARRRVEAASAATKRAENLDAIVKAAELVAEAVSQAGTIIGMGDPIPLTLTELVEAGPGGFSKVQKGSSDPLVHSGDINIVQSNKDIVEGLVRFSKHSNERPSNKKMIQKSTEQGGPHPLNEMSKQSVENPMGLVNGMPSNFVTSVAKCLGGQKGRKVSELAKTIGVVPESEIGSRTASITVQSEEYAGHQPSSTSKENVIQEGSLVEVLSDKDGLKGVWFSAKVLNLKDGKVYVCYTDILSDKGSGPLMEWVSLEVEGEKAPRIRIARPMTIMKFEGTRKRRRAAMGDHVWSVGDKVDAWIRDGWWEGTVTGKSKEDEMTLTVHFPAKGDTSVRAWDLRPSLIWRDGEWLECSSLKENNSIPNMGDTPREKRPKLNTNEAEVDPAVEDVRKNNLSKNMGNDGSGIPVDLKALALSAKEKVFSMGKNTREETNSYAARMKRTGLQKEGSKVIFGVPKPGKKRKFMEVSKHYVEDKGGKIGEGTDSIKFAKYLIPQGSSSRVWKNTSKFDSRGKQAAESKPKVLKSRKGQIVSNRSMSEKESTSMAVVSSSNDDTARDHLPNVNAFSASHVGSVSEKKSSLVVEAGTGRRGKLIPSVEKFTGNEDKDSGHSDNPEKTIPEVVEPRRSNRRIQPTSRLLEGLQSSMLISKIPAVSHEKGSKGQHKSVSSLRGNNNG